MSSSEARQRPAARAKPLRPNVGQAVIADLAGQFTHREKSFAKTQIRATLPAWQQS